MDHTSLLFHIRFSSVAFKRRKLARHRFDLRNIGDFVRVRGTVNHVFCVVLPIVHEKVVEKENQRPVEVIDGCIQIVEYRIGVFDARTATTKSESGRAGISRTNVLLPITFLA